MEEIIVPDDIQRLCIKRNKEIKRLQKRNGYQKKTLSQITNGEGIKPGQVWRPKASQILTKDEEGKLVFETFQMFDSIPHLVMVTKIEQEPEFGCEILHVLPIHGEKLERDSLIEKSISPMGYRFYLQTWNPCIMLACNLEICFGEVKFRNQKHFDMKTSLIESLSNSRPSGLFLTEWRETSYLREPYKLHKN